VVDNASTDGTLEAIQACAAGNPRVKVQELPANIGFAAANNAGVHAAAGDYLVLLNSDTVVTSGWLGRLLRHLQRDPTVGLVCPVTNFAGNEAMIDYAYSSAQEMQTFAQELARSHEGRLLDIEVAPLFCAMARKALWDELSGLDERFEIGMFEDDDLSLRVRQAGFGIFAAEDCFIHHFGQGSFSQLAPETYNRIFEANRRRFEEKWNQPWAAHRTRPGVRPAFEEARFDPVAFTSEPSA